MNSERSNLASRSPLRLWRVSATSLIAAVIVAQLAAVAALRLGAGWPSGLMLPIAFVAAAYFLPLYVTAAATIANRTLRFVRGGCRFGIRTLLILFIVAAIPLAWSARAVRAIRKEQWAVQQIKQMPGGVLYDSEYDEKHWMFSRASGVRNWVGRLLGEEAMNDVTYVYIGSTMSRTPGSIEIGGIKNDVSDRNIPQLQTILAEFPRLQHLYLQHTRITSAGVRRLQEEFPAVTIEYESSNDEGYVPRIYGRYGFQWAPGEPLGTKLLGADLRRAEFYDDDLAYFVHYRQYCGHVETINLRGTTVTDAGLVHLGGLKSLRELDVRDTSVTDEAVKELQKALPECRILY
jgi:hypothetical protein